MLGDKNAEIRDGFAVSEKRKKIWETQIALLKDLQRVCEKYHLCYFATNGTLLGAVRHKGFIPWDDDMDVCMPRHDYERLTEVAAEEFKEPHYLHTEFSSVTYYRPYMRLRNASTTAVPEMDWNREKVNGIFIDIFPIDGVPKGKITAYMHSLHIRLRIWLAFNFVYGDVCTKHKCLHKMLQGYLKLLFKKGKYLTFLKKTRLIQSKYAYEDCEYVSLATHGNIVLPKILFEPISVPFESLSITVPKGYDQILTALYGNYMELPSEEKRGQRHTIFFDPDAPYEQYYGKMDFEEVRSELNNY